MATEADWQVVVVVAQMQQAPTPVPAAVVVAVVVRPDARATQALDPMMASVVVSDWRRSR